MMAGRGEQGCRIGQTVERIRGEHDGAGGPGRALVRPHDVISEYVARPPGTVFSLKPGQVVEQTLALNPLVGITAGEILGAAKTTAYQAVTQPMSVLRSGLGYSRKLAEIQALAVLSSLQGKGVGSELVRRCVGRARAEGVLELMAITASDNLFRNVGFDYSLPNQKRALFLQTRDGESQG